MDEREMKDEDGGKEEDEMEDEEMEDEEMEDEDEEEMDAGGDAKPKKEKKQQVYIPGKSKLGKADGEELEFDPSAYRFLHPFQTEAPCLSFDPLRLLPDPSAKFPLSVTFVAGTQAEKVRSNAIVLTRLGNIHGRSKADDDEDDSDSEEEDEDAETTSGRKPQLRTASIPHHGGINRIRAAALGSAHVCAAWNEAGKVQIWNLGTALASLDKEKGKVLKGEKPLHTFPGHQVEGYGLDWSPLKEGRLASGDNRGRIYLWEMGDGATWTVNQIPLTHSGSVEDIQWSPTEANVLASCSSDASLCLWDARAKPAEANIVRVEKAHDGDVNVLSWNKAESLLLSGGDDGALKVWDLKTIQYGEAACVLNYHSAPISSVAWCPGLEGEGTVLAASGEDDQVSVWDIAVEADDGADSELPPQLLFMHMGQKEVKELRWTPDATGALLTTALDGFNFFRTISV